MDEIEQVVKDNYYGIDPNDKQILNATAAIREIQNFEATKLLIIFDTLTAHMVKNKFPQCDIDAMDELSAFICGVS